mmetsp:Transcript_9225/g.24997  ORF Transcript_9225/g.24997 Transcript_9225/m.24997 type:complete len:384 (+) Transcript_9225:35-1186(+)
MFQRDGDYDSDDSTKRRSCTRCKDEETVQDHLVLDPLQKWRKYKKVVAVVNRDASYIRSRTITFEEYFLPAGATGPDLTTVDDYMAALQDIGARVQEFPETSVDYYELLPVNGTSGAPTLLLTVTRYNDSISSLVHPESVKFDSTEITSNFWVFPSNITSGTPFDAKSQAELQREFFLMSSLKVSFRLKGVPVVDGERSCLLWDVSIQLYGDTTFFTPTLTTNTMPCSVGEWVTNVVSAVGGLSVSVFILAIVNVFLVFKAIAVNMKVYAMLRRELDTTSAKKRKLYHFFVASVDKDSFSKTWSTLGIGEKLRFFNRWFIVNVAGNICQVVASCMLIFADDGQKSRITGSLMRLLIGFGSAFAWIAVVRYLEYSKKNYVSAPF